MAFPFYSPELARDRVAAVGVAPDAAHRLGLILASSSLAAEIQQGNVTLAMFRPGLDEATTLTGSDPDIAETLESHIERLGILAKFAIRFDADMVEEFYGGSPKEVQLACPPEKRMEYSSRWPEFVDLMTSGPTTALLLYSPEGEAVQLWRGQLGHWDINNRRDPATIRGAFGRDNYNNLVHGSDAPQSVQREISIIHDSLTK